MYDDGLQVVRDVTALGPPAAAAQLEGLLDQAPAILGFDLKKDLLDPLGNVVCLYSDRNQGFFGFDVALAVKVDDAPTLRKTVNQLLARLAAESNNEFAIRQVRKHGRDLVVFEFAMFPLAPAFVIDDDWLVAGLGPQTVETFLLRLDGKLPKWKPNEAYQRGLAELPKKFSAIVVTDPRETVRAILGVAPMLIGVVQMGLNQRARFVPGAAPAAGAIRATDIPPAELVVQPLFPNVSTCTVDAAGVHWQSRTSVPSIPLLTGLGGGSGVAVAGTLVALMLPAVQQARVAARRSQSKNNMKQIGLALHNYHDVHRSFPQGTHPNEDLKVEKRLSWMADILPFADQAPLFKQIDFAKAWDDKANAGHLKSVVPVFQNPQIVAKTNPDFGTTHYVGIAGVGKDGPILAARHKRAGIFAYNRATRIRDITDGTSNTVAVSEAISDFGPWGAGGKSTLRALVKKPYINGPDGIGSPFPGGCHMLFADGSVRFVSENIDPTLLERLASMADGQVIGSF